MELVGARQPRQQASESRPDAKRHFSTPCTARAGTHAVVLLRGARRCRGRDVPLQPDKLLQASVTLPAGDAAFALLGPQRAGAWRGLAWKG